VSDTPLKHRRASLARLARRVSWLLAAVLVLAGCGQAAAGATATAQSATAAIEHGQALFRNKGCVTCHLNARVPGRTGLLQVGPDLSYYKGDPEFLRTWLADPRSVRPDTPMPNLGLTSAEIEDLIAFLTAPR
jgi:cytochrome c2